MKWPFFRKTADESLAVSMAGIKLGDRLLVVGCSDPMLIARLAVKTGLTGRAHAIDADELRPCRSTAGLTYQLAQRYGTRINRALRVNQRRHRGQAEQYPQNSP